MQQVRVTDLKDLGFLDNLPNLRAAYLAGPGDLDLAALRAVPVETLELKLRSVDLTPLAGHAELRSLTLISKDSVDLAPLRAIPHLWALDVSAASVADIDVIAELPRLRYLEARQDQWYELWQRDDLPPFSAVGVHPGPPRRDWPGRACWKTVQGRPPQRHTGRYTTG
ncbi:hypothetical protein [Nonomuraea guangzhouensis]|uniref:Leucine-rich repeat domain-containing protein n=1 Tax=Nonomuraea guangzhouensis TaxID=1291555 RepID=A0ABW4GGH2_9ACTN|nr:hypothetical protein [Nonomuraea guangzhouensis]